TAERLESSAAAQSIRGNHDPVDSGRHWLHRPKWETEADNEALATQRRAAQKRAPGCDRNAARDTKHHGAWAIDTIKRAARGRRIVPSRRVAGARRFLHAESGDATIRVDTFTPADRRSQAITSVPVVATMKFKLRKNPRILQGNGATAS